MYLHHNCGRQQKKATFRKLLLKFYTCCDCNSVSLKNDSAQYALLQSRISKYFLLAFTQLEGLGRHDSNIFPHTPPVWRYPISKITLCTHPKHVELVTAAVMDLYIMEIFYNKSLFDYG